MIEINKNSGFFSLFHPPFFSFPEESDLERGKHHFPSCRGRKTFWFEGILLKHVTKTFYFSSFKINSLKNLVSRFLPLPTANAQRLFSPFVLDLSLVGGLVVCYHNEWMKQVSAKLSTEKFKKKRNFTSSSEAGFYLSPQFHVVAAKAEEIWVFE